MQIELLEHVLVCPYNLNSCLSLRCRRPRLLSSPVLPWEAITTTKLTQETEAFFLPLVLCCAFPESKFLRLGNEISWNLSTGCKWLRESNFWAVCFTCVVLASSSLCHNQKVLSSVWVNNMITHKSVITYFLEILRMQGFDSN